MIFWVTSICKRFNKEWQLHYRGCTISFSFILIITSIEASETDDVIDLFSNSFPRLENTIVVHFIYDIFTLEFMRGKKTLSLC